MGKKKFLVFFTMCIFFLWGFSRLSLSFQEEKPYSCDSLPLEKISEIIKSPIKQVRPSVRKGYGLYRNGTISKCTIDYSEKDDQPFLFTIGIEIFSGGKADRIFEMGKRGASTESPGMQSKYHEVSGLGEKAFFTSVGSSNRSFVVLYKNRLVTISSNVPVSDPPLSAWITEDQLKEVVLTVLETI